MLDVRPAPKITISNPYLTIEGISTITSLLTNEVEHDWRKSGILSESRICNREFATGSAKTPKFQPKNLTFRENRVFWANEVRFIRNLNPRLIFPYWRSSKFCHPIWPKNIWVSIMTSFTIPTANPSKIASFDHARLKFEHVCDY